MRNQIVVLAAGKGTRMGSSELPKVLVMLKNKPLILYLLQEIAHINQLVKPVVVAGYMHDKVEAVLGDGYTYALQLEQKGTGHAVMAAKDKIKAENILVLYGDMPFIKANSLKKLMRLHHDKQAVLSMFTAEVPHFSGEYESLNHFGRIIRDFTGKVIKITEYKDATDTQRQIKEVNPGIYMFNTKWLWENIKKIKDKNVQKEYYLTDLIEIAIQEGVKIESLAIEPREVFGINTLEQLSVAERLV